MTPVLATPELSAHQRELVAEMLDRLDAALAEGAPLFAQQRMLSDLSVYAAFLSSDPAFRQRLSSFELALARDHAPLLPAHLAELRAGFASLINL